MRLSRASTTTVAGRRLAAGLGACGLAGAGAAAIPAAAAASPVTQVRAVYRSVLTAEYFGPSSRVCGRLTPAGKASFTAGGGGTCAHAYAAERKVLRHKVPDVDDSGYTPTQWRQVVNQTMAGLKVTVNGSKAHAIGPSGIPGRTGLAKIAGRWLFTTYPPSVGS
jgi:hypothetical protein